MHGHKDNADRANRFRKLAQAVQLAPLVESPDRTPECESTRELLDVFAEIELSGGDADLQFPFLAAHLSGCPACRAALHDLVEILQAERTRELEELPALTFPTLPFLESSALAIPWRVRLRSALAGARQRFQFTLDSEYLQQLLTPPHAEGAPALRALPAAAPQPQLMLADIVQVGDQSIACEIMVLAQPDAPESVFVQAHLAAKDLEFDRLVGSLHWGNQERRARADAQGKIDFGSFLRSELRAVLAAPENQFEIAFEIETD